MTNADMPAGPDWFSSTNLVVLAVWVELAPRSVFAADAWVHAHSAFMTTFGNLTRLVVTPADGDGEVALQRERSTILAALERYAGFQADNPARSTLEFELRPASEHPGRARRTALLASVNGAINAATPGHDANLIQLQAALQTARISAAGSQSCGAYDVIVGPAGATAEAVYDVSSDLWAYCKQERRAGRPEPAQLNNFSPVVEDLSTAQVLAALPQVQPPDEREVIVGVILPGGTAAPTDVVGKLEHLSGVSVQEQRVYVTDAANLIPAMVRAVDTLVQNGAHAIVVGFGGGELHRLNRIMVAVQAAVDGRLLPIFVGVGHRDFNTIATGAHVRTCATPADATELFRVEMLDIPRQRAALTRTASIELTRAVGSRPAASEKIASDLLQNYAALQVDLEQARARHGQVKADR